jgi:RNA polymerase sigma-32 factor
MTSCHRYSRDVHAHPMLSPDEQHALAHRYAKGRDPGDARRLVLANLRLVITIARKLGGATRPDLMDLIQEGNAGLMVAVDRFDPSRGPRLSAYASFWIRAFILRHIMETSHVVRSTTTREGRRRFFARELPNDVCLDAPAGRGGHDRDARASRLDLMRADDMMRPDVAAEAREDLRRLQVAMTRFEATLDQRQRTILNARMLSESPRPLRQLGATIDLSGERVRQLEQEMLARLRALVMDPDHRDVRAAA